MRILKTAARETNLEAKGQPHDTLSVVLLGSSAITEINENFLQHEGPTDVITFDYSDEPRQPDEPAVTGEILVCLDVAQEAAHQHQTSFSEEVILYCVHGMLHLVGFDDHTKSDKADMRAAEARVMSALRERHKLPDLFAANNA